LEQATERLCNVFDYETVKQSGRASSVITLRKRYSHTYDVPGVTIEECALSLADIERILGRYSGNGTDRGKIVWEAWNALSVDQRQRLRDGIPISSLTPTQKARYFEVARWFYTGTLLKNLTPSRFSLEQAENVSLSSRTRNGKVEVTTSTKDQYGVVTVPLRNTAKNPAGLPQLEDLFATRPATIGETASRLNASSLTVQKALLEKPLTVAGEDRAGISPLVSAIALSYGLRGTQRQTNVWAIERPRGRDATNLGEVYPAIFSALPSPLMRALDASKERARKDAVEKRLTALRSKGFPSLTVAEQNEFRLLMREKMRNQIRPVSFSEERATQIANECRRRLEYLYNKQANGRVGYTVPLLRLGREAREAYAAFVMIGFLQSAEHILEGEAPVYITDFNNLIVMGGEDGSGIQISIGSRNTQGQARPMIGMGMPRNPVR
jgi:hypothetical protein